VRAGTLASGSGRCEHGEEERAGGEGSYTPGSLLREAAMLTPLVERFRRPELLSCTLRTLCHLCSPGVCFLHPVSPEWHYQKARYPFCPWWDLRTQREAEPHQHGELVRSLASSQQLQFMAE